MNVMSRATCNNFISFLVMKQSSDETTDATVRVRMTEGSNESTAASPKKLPSLRNPNRTVGSSPETSMAS